MAGLQADPAFRAVLRDMAGRWVERYEALETPSQVELYSLAVALYRAVQRADEYGRIVMLECMALGFGVSKDVGFYFDTSATDDLRVYVDARIPGLTATGRIAARISSPRPPQFWRRTAVDDRSRRRRGLISP